jgi:hypothetical protein
MFTASTSVPGQARVGHFVMGTLMLCKVAKPASPSTLLVDTSSLDRLAHLAGS